MAIYEDSNGVTITTTWECKGPPLRSCGVRVTDSHFYKGRPGTSHRDIIFLTMGPLECPEHGKKYMKAVAD